MLAIFDIDGTVCDTQDVEERCYATAFEEVCGVSLSTLDWNEYPEATSSGIFHSVLDDRPDLLKPRTRVRISFCSAFEGGSAGISSRLFSHLRCRRIHRSSV